MNITKLNNMNLGDSSIIVGDLNELYTDDKSNVVNAINEISEISKIAPSLTISSSDVTVMRGNSSVLTFTTDSDGESELIVSDVNTATATINNGTITINGINEGSTIIALKINRTSTYKAVIQNISVTVAPKPVPELTLSDYDVEIEEGSNQSVTVTTDSNGIISAISNNTNIATVSVSETTITINGVAQGTTTILVNISETSSFAAISATINVTVTQRPCLENYTWAQIAAIGAAGTGANYFDIGDTKTITLNGTVGTLSLSNYQCKVFIIHFNYRSTNGIYFQGFKDMNGVDIALADSNYNSSSYDGSKYFSMEHWGTNSFPYNTNYGGWKGCDLRYDILGSTSTKPSGYGSTATTSRVGYDATSKTKTSPVSNTLMAALPSDLRSALATWTVYTDNAGTPGSTQANVTTSIDYLPLLAEFEVQGVANAANEYEQNNQTQMAYYANGNSKRKYRHDSTSNTCIWWLRSPNRSLAYAFCCVNGGGYADMVHSRNSYCLAPAFRLA